MIKVGNIVECKYYNTPERKFYGELFKAEVVGVIEHSNLDNNLYIVKRPDLPWNTTLKRKEIKRVVK